MKTYVIFLSAVRYLFTMTYRWLEEFTNHGLGGVLSGFTLKDYEELKYRSD